MEKLIRMFAMLAVAAGLAIGATGCDYDESDDNDHEPPPGQGSLVIYNNTSDDIAVFVDGVRLDDVGDYNDRAYDLDPGVRRVILDQRGGDRTFADDVDILADRRTIMDVDTDTFDTLDYDVVIFFD